MRGFGETMIQVGQELEQIKLEEMRVERTARHNAEMALMDAEHESLLNSAKDFLDKNDVPNPDEWIDKDYWKPAETKLSALTTTRTTKAASKNWLIGQKERDKRTLKVLWEKKQYENELGQFYALVTNSKEHKFFVDEPELVDVIDGYHTSFKEFKEGGRILQIKTPQQLAEYQEETSQTLISDFLIQHPDKIDKDGKILKDYYIDHPNEFVDENDLRVNDYDKEGNEIPGKKLLGPENIADLKITYQTTKNANERIIKEELDALQEKKAVEYTLKIKRNELKDPKTLDSALEKNEITRTVYKELYNLLSKGSAEKDDPESLMKSYEAIDDVRHGKRTARDTYDEILGYSTKLKDTTLEGLIPKLFPTTEKPMTSWEEEMKKGIDLAYGIKEKTDEYAGKIEKTPELVRWKVQKYNEMNQFIKKYEDAGTEPTPQQIQEFLNSTFKETGSSFLSDIWKGIKLGMFLPPVGAANLISKKSELEKAKSKRASNLDMTKRFPGETISEYKLRKSIGPLDEVVKNE